MFLRQPVALKNSATKLAAIFFGLVSVHLSCAHGTSAVTSEISKKAQTRTKSTSPVVLLSKELPNSSKTELIPDVIKKAQTAEECFALGLQFERNRNYRSATHAYRSSLNFEQDFHRARINLGLVLVRLQSAEEAKKQCQRVIDAVPDSALAWYCLGLSHFHKKEFSAAQKSFSHSLELRTPAPVVRLQLARSHLELGQIQKGIQELSLTSSAARNRPEILLHIAKEFEGLSRIEDAEATYLLTLKQSPKNYLAAIKLAKLYKKSSSPQRAEPYFKRAIEVRPTSVSAILAYLDWRLRSAMDLKPALLQIDKITKIDLRYKVKVAYYFWVDGQHDKALTFVRSALAQKPSTGQQIALENLRQRIIRKDDPKLSIPYYSPKPVTPKKRLPKSQIPEE
ncbi:MAG: tetratricopeptide repeat protein [Myxococcota bacterium]|nr:tetratricopeptide repeat protein [Myxococcota bacterium]